MDNKKKKALSLDKIVSQDEALKEIKQSSIGLAIIGGLSLIAGFIVSPAAIIDGAIILILTLILYKKQSRTAAIFLIIMTLISVVSVIVNMVNGSPFGGLIISIFALYFSYRAVQATMFLQKK